MKLKAAVPRMPWQIIAVLIPLWVGFLHAQNTQQNFEEKAQSSSGKPAPVLRVAADFSLRGVLAKIGADFSDTLESQGKNLDVELDLAAGLELLERAEVDASRADVWVLQSHEHMQRLSIKNKLRPQSARTLALDNLAVVSAWPVVRSGPVPSWPELALARWRRVAIANFRTSPSGEAAVRALKTAGVWQKLDYRVEILPTSDEVLSDLMRAQVDAALIYRSESRRLPQRTSFTVWELKTSDTEFVICGAVSAETSRKELAHQFLEYAARQNATWKEFGFESANVLR